VAFNPCFAPEGFAVTRVADGMTPGLVVTGTLGAPAAVNILQCTSNAHCNDGLFCNGAETCVNNSCVPGVPPCSGATPVCMESTDSCVVCTSNVHCTNGVFCDGQEFCQANQCHPGGTPCPPGFFCDEDEDRCIECFSKADCDDGFACTTDQCILGDCYHTPDDADCDDGLFCNGAEICDLDVGCMSTGNPCHNPASCNEITDTCGSCPTPAATAEGPRYLRVTPAPGPDPVALLVTGSPGDPETSCLLRYVRADGGLDSTPVFQTPAQWSTVDVTGQEIRPSETYRICADCGGGSLSAAAAATTWSYGDGDNDGDVDLDDILCALSGFSGLFDQPPSFCALQSLDLMGADCVPDGNISLDDILQELNGFQGQQTTPAALCPPVCP
jgi:hypothetical protein